MNIIDNKLTIYGTQNVKMKSYEKEQMIKWDGRNNGIEKEVQDDLYSYMQAFNTFFVDKILNSELQTREISAQTHICRRLPIKSE